MKGKNIREAKKLLLSAIDDALEIAYREGKREAFLKTAEDLTLTIQGGRKGKND